MAKAQEAHVAVFAPVTILTITLEQAADGPDEVHVHPGGQGVWQARMVKALDSRATICTLLGGEPGTVLDGLLSGEELEHPTVEMSAANPTWIHDRRSGEREVMWESQPFTIGRHELDELFSATLAAALRAGVCVLAGTHEGVGALEPDTYRRLVSDLRAADVQVVVDLTSEELACALEGSPNVVKVSDDDMRRDGRLDGSSRADLERLVASLHGEGAEHVVVSRAETGALASDGKKLVEVDAPRLDVADPRGAGDSMTGALGVGLARGLPWEETLRLSAAAGAVNVTRHGSGSGRHDTVTELTERVRVVEAVGE